MGWFRTGDSGRGGVKSEEAASGRDCTASDCSTLLVGDPTGVISKVANITTIAIERKNGDEADSRRRNVEDVFQEKLMSGSNGNIDGSDACGENAGSTKSFDRTRRDGSPGTEIRTFGRDVNVGASVEDERAFLDIYRGEATGDVGRGRGGNVGLEEIDGVRV